MSLLGRLPSRRDIWPFTLAIAAAVLTIDAVRGDLFEHHKRIKNLHDVYFLPPPDEVVTMSLGYRSAVADLLWAHTLVESGLHVRRRFDNLNRLYDAINALDPLWRRPYVLADALITFQPPPGGTVRSDAKVVVIQPHVDDVIKARQILERGVEHFPNDGELWLNLGQFVAFMAPANYLEDHPELAERWRREGAAMLERAAELGEAWQALGGTGILLESGERESAIRLYERAYAVTDDDELKAYIADKLRRLIGERDMQARQELEEAFEEAARDGLPFLRKDEAMALGPRAHPAACAGPGHDAEPHCAHSWAEWFERQEQLQRGAEPAR